MTFKETIMDIWLVFSFQKFAISVAKLNKNKQFKCLQWYKLINLNAQDCELR